MEDLKKIKRPNDGYKYNGKSREANLRSGLGLNGLTTFEASKVLVELANSTAERLREEAMEDSRRA